MDAANLHNCLPMSNVQMINAVCLNTTWHHCTDFPDDWDTLQIYNIIMHSKKFLKTTLKRHILTFHKDSPLAVEIENPPVSEIDKLKVKCLFCESTFTRRSDR